MIKYSIIINLIIFFFLLIKIPNKKRLPIGSILFVFPIIFAIIDGTFILTDKISFISLFLIYLIGVFDDLYELNVFTRFILILFLIFIIVYINFNRFNIGLFETLYFNYFFIIFMILGFIHTLNMIDGIDGYYISYVIICSTLLLFVSNNDFLDLNYLFIASFFFFILNLKSKIIIGNSGNYTISTILSLYLLKDNQNNFEGTSLIFDEFFIIILFFFPLIDGVRVSVLRMINFKSPFSKDDKHLHLIFKNKIRNFLIIVTMQILMIILYVKFNNFYILFPFFLIIYLLYLKKGSDIFKLNIDK